ANRGNWPMAKQLFREVKDMRITEPQIQEQVEEFGRVIKNRGTIKAAQSGRFRGAMPQQSKKRRRPRMKQVLDQRIPFDQNRWSVLQVYDAYDEFIFCQIKQMTERNSS